MTATTVSPKVKRNIFWSFWRRWQALRQNPVSTKELRGRMRGGKAFLILTIHLTVLSGIVILIYYGFSRAFGGPFGPQPQDVGKSIFGAVVLVQAIMVLFIGPAATAGAISGEKERQTYEILRTTLLSASDFVSGKLLSGLSYVFLLVIASIPLQSIAFLLGGIGLAEIIIAELLIFVSAVAYALLGLFASSALRSTLAATVATYGTAIFLTIGVPGIMIFIAFLMDSIGGRITEIVLMYLLIGLVSLNLPATLIATELFLMEENSLLGFTNTVGGFTYLIPSPWYINLILFTLLSLILYKVVVRRVRRIPS
jgi:ABC-type transport system involved in multi-copper enzyme maturation permease subunit